MMDPQQNLEAIFRELAGWGSVDEFRLILRSARPDEIVTLLKAARRLDLLDDPEKVQQKVALIEQLMDAHKTWEQRTKDLNSMARIFAAAGGIVLTLWAVWDRFIAWFMR